MAITRKQAAGANNAFANHNPISATFASAVTAGSLLVCFFEGNSNTSAPTCSDNINGAWSTTTWLTDIPASSKGYTFFYKVGSAAASAGAMTVTVTPNATTGTTEILQIAEYAGAGALDSAITAHASQASGTPATLTTGVPTITGDLILFGFASDTQSNKTFSATSGITGIVLDASSKTGGETNGTATMGFGELLGASTSAVSLSMGLGNGDDGGKLAIGFRATTAGSKTQTAIARIAKNLTKTQTAIARIANNRSKTQTAISRIAQNRSLTQGAVTRIAQNRNKTQTATANIQVASSMSKTQSAIARIANVRSKTQSAVAYVTQPKTKTQTAVASIVINVAKSMTQSATARIIIAASRSKTQTARARIAVNVFTPPTNDILSPIYTPDRRDISQPVPESSQRLFRFFSLRKRGITVLGYANGTFVSKLNPSQDDLDAASVIYLGGHTYEVSGDQATALTDAGYTVAVSS
jgi:hypothetical protein